MQYIKLQFSGEITGEGYQEISNGEQIRLTDLDGNTLDIVDKIYEGKVIDANPPFPEWGITDLLPEEPPLNP